MAYAFRYLIRLVVERVDPNALKPVGVNRLHLRAFLALALVVFASVTNLLCAAEHAGRITVFSSRPISDLVFVPRPAAPKQKLTFYPTARSPRYEFRSPMPLRFTDATTGAVVAEATIPPDIRDALLLFSPITPVPASGVRYQISILDDGVLRHGPGGLSILNLSGLALSGTVGTEDVNLQAGLSPTLILKSSAKVVLRTSDKGRSYQAYAETISLKKSERALLILFPPFYKGSHEVQSRLLVDQPAAPPSAPARK